MEFCSSGEKPLYDGEIMKCLKCKEGKLTEVTVDTRFYKCDKCEKWSSKKEYEAQGNPITGGENEAKEVRY